MIGKKGAGQQLGGWGYFIGLKAGSPVTPVSEAIDTATAGTSISTTISSSGPSSKTVSKPVTSNVPVPHLVTDTSIGSKSGNRASSKSTDANTTVCSCGNTQKNSGGLLQRSFEDFKIKLNPFTYKSYF